MVSIFKQDLCQCVFAVLIFEIITISGWVEILIPIDKNVLDPKMTLFLFEGPIYTEI